MRNFHFNLIAALLMVLSTTGLFAQGTQNSFFNSSLIQSILNQEGCAGIRVYPAIDPGSGMPVVLIIGVDGNGNELYNAGSAISKYMLYTGAKTNEVTYVGLDEQAARTACLAYTAGNPAFNSVLNDAVIEASMASGSSGIAIMYVAQGDGNFSVSGYTSQGGPRPSGQASSGSPCPSACGDPSQYLVYP